MGTHTTLAELSLFKPLRPVRVKVICKGTTEVGSTFEKSHLILGDENVSYIILYNLRYYIFPSTLY